MESRKAFTVKYFTVFHGSGEEAPHSSKRIIHFHARPLENAFHSEGKSQRFGLESEAPHISQRNTEYGLPRMLLETPSTLRKTETFWSEKSGEAPHTSQRISVFHAKLKAHGHSG